MKNPINKSGGFTLLEIIISIMALSMISVVILRMFIASAGLNERARNTDIAISHLITEIEKLKKHTSLSDYMETDAPVNVVKNAEIITVSFYYDKDWKRLIQPGNAVPIAAEYGLQLVISPASGVLPEDLSPDGRLYDVNTEIASTASHGTGLPLASIRTKKYFTDDIKEGGV